MRKILKWLKGNFKKNELLNYFGVLGGFASIISLLPEQGSKIRIIIALSFLTILLGNLIYEKIRTIRKVPIPSADDLHFINEPRCTIDTVKSKRELESIVELAKKNYPCPINGMDYKLPIWKKNKNTFFVIKGPTGIVKANINLLPLKEEAFFDLRDGKITEQEISPEDIYSRGYERKVKYVYVEGLLAKSFEGNGIDILSIYLIFLNFESIISIMSYIPSDVIICAIGGSKEGIQLLKRLKFKKAVKKSERKDNMDFYYLEFDLLKNSLAKRDLEQIANKFNKGTLG